MKISLTFICMIACTVIANLLMKTGVIGMEAGTGGFFSRLLTLRVIVGLAFFGAAAMFYLVILSWIPLGVAQSFAAAQFVAVILAAWIILAEPIVPIQWFGMFLIAIGIAIVGVGK